MVRQRGTHLQNKHPHPTLHHQGQRSAAHGLRARNRARAPETRAVARKGRDDHLCPHSALRLQHLQADGHAPEPPREQDPAGSQDRLLHDVDLHESGRKQLAAHRLVSCAQAGQQRRAESARWCEEGKAKLVARAAHKVAAAAARGRLMRRRAGGTGTQKWRRRHCARTHVRGDRMACSRRLGATARPGDEAPENRRRQAAGGRAAENGGDQRGGCRHGAEKVEGRLAVCSQARPRAPKQQLPLRAQTPGSRCPPRRRDRSPRAAQAS